jgi:hypothetical protein
VGAWHRNTLPVCEPQGCRRDATGTKRPFSRIHGVDFAPEIFFVNSAFACLVSWRFKFFLAKNFLPSRWDLDRFDDEYLPLKWRVLFLVVPAGQSAGRLDLRFTVYNLGKRRGNFGSRVSEWAKPRSTRTMKGGTRRPACGIATSTSLGRGRRGAPSLPFLHEEEDF